MLSVELKQVPNVYFAVEASMNCVGKEMPPGMSGEECIQYLRKRIDDGHLGVLEHIVYQFKVTDLTRAALQELVRHRMASYLVESTRWALKKKLNKGALFASLFRSTGDVRVDALVYNQIRALAWLPSDIPNDKLKYAIPEAMYTTVYMTINGSSLRNFMVKRWSKRALEEMRDLTLLMYYELPKLHRPLFTDLMEIDVGLF